MKNEIEAKMATLIARCWTDVEFRKRFIADPKSVIAEALLGLAPDAELIVLEDTREKRHLVLPEAPLEGFSMTHIQSAAQQMFGMSSLYCCGEQPVSSGGRAETGSTFKEEAGDAAPYCRETAAPYCDELAAPYCRETAAPYCDEEREKSSGSRMPPMPYCEEDKTRE